MDDIIIPFMGGTIKFLKAIDWVGKTGAPGHLDDRVEVYGDTKTPSRMSPRQFHTMLEAIENREDVKAWLSALVE